MRLPSDVAAHLIELQDAAAPSSVRYRVYALVTIDQRVMASVAEHIRDTFDGVILDTLAPDVGCGDPVAAAPMTLVDWLHSKMGDARPRCLLHIDAILSTWRRAEDHRIWWEQASMIERTCPLFIPTARHEIATIERWGRVGPLWVDNSEVDVLAPRASSHFAYLTQGRL